jgi:DNA uptake protein ComE-like DNA-binding protein
MKYSNKKIFLLILVFFTSLGILRAEFEQQALSGRIAAMAQAVTAASNDATAVVTNPAGLVNLGNLQVVTGHDKLFGMSELKRDFISVAQPFIQRADLVAGFSWQRFGSTSLYKETTFTFSFGRKVSQKIAMGLGFNFFDQSIIESPNRSSVGVDLGLLFMPSKNFRIGFVTKNLNNPRLNEELKQIIRGGVALLKNGNVFSLDFEKTLDEDDLNWRVGEEYWMSKNFVLRGGFETNPMRFTAGFGLRFYNWQVDYAYQSHQVLDLTHTISVTFDFSTIHIKVPGFRWYDKKAYQKEKEEKKKKAELNQIVEIEDTPLEKKVKIVGGKDFYTSTLKKEVKKIKDVGEKLKGPLNINKADIKDLMKLPGVNRKLANNILIYRYINGDIKSKKELLKVPGFKESTWKKCGEFVQF